MPFTVKIQGIATATDWTGGISQPEEVPVSVAVGVSAQPDKAVGRGVLRDGHVEQLHLVHLAGHVAFLQQTNKQKQNKNDGGEMWVMEKREAYRFLFLFSVQRIKRRL